MAEIYFFVSVIAGTFIIIIWILSGSVDKVIKAHIEHEKRTEDMVERMWNDTNDRLMSRNLGEHKYFSKPEPAMDKTDIEIEELDDVQDEKIPTVREFIDTNIAIHGDEIRLDKGFIEHVKFLENHWKGKK